MVLSSLSFLGTLPSLSSLLVLPSTRLEPRSSEIGSPSPTPFNAYLILCLIGPFSLARRMLGYPLAWAGPILSLAATEYGSVYN